MTTAKKTAEAAPYFGTWTVAYEINHQVRHFKHLSGYTRKEAIDSALRYMAGWKVKIVDAWQTPRFQQLPLPL